MSTPYLRIAHAVVDSHTAIVQTGDAMISVRCILTCLWLLSSLTATTDETTPPQTPFNYRELLRQGLNLSPEAAEELGRKADADFEDFESRIPLLAYYEAKGRRSPVASEAHQQLVFWLIQNHPSSPVAGRREARIDIIKNPNGYAKAKDLWLDSAVTHRENAMVLGNAAQFLFYPDMVIAERFLKKARVIQPNNAEWSRQLGRVYYRQSKRATGKERQKLAAKALTEFERTMELDEDPLQMYFLLHDIPRVSLEAGSTQKAEQYANQLLKMSKEEDYSWNNGNAVHHGNLVLGRLALQAADVEKAKSHLLEAGKTRGSPKLNSFGPNMTLAKELLEKGEKEVVLEYFELCAKFWERDELDKWRTIVKAGQIPDFGANLRY